MSSLTFLHHSSSLPTIGTHSCSGVRPEEEVPSRTKPSAAGTTGVNLQCLPFPA